eukprot:1996432-Alexandrium_andersonii.AAC.1
MNNNGCTNNSGTNKSTNTDNTHMRTKRVLIIRRYFDCEDEHDDDEDEDENDDKQDEDEDEEGYLLRAGREHSPVPRPK